MDVDDLYALPLEEFTAARNALAREQPEAKGLRKPSLAAWAVNQLARRHRRELDAFLGAAAQLREAQLEGGDVAAATRDERDALRRLLQLAGEYASAAQAGRVRQTLQAAAADEGAAEQVRAGRLERELEPAGFGSLLAAAPTARSAGPKQRRSDDRARRLAEAEAALQEARTALDEAESAERGARDAWERARQSLDEARGRVRDAERRVREARRR